MSKILNLTITELVYSHILSINRGSLHTRSFRGVDFSVFRYSHTDELKWLYGSEKVSRDFEKRAPGFSSRAI